MQSLGGKVHDLITERTKDNEILPRLGEQALAESGFYLQRLENLEKVWTLMAQPNKDKGAPPLARWIEKNPEREGDYIIEVSPPLEVGYRLDQLLWSRAAGSILVSATLRALNQFDYFCRQAGIFEKDSTRFLALASPFDYQNNARLVIPAMPLEPPGRQVYRFTNQNLA